MAILKLYTYPDKVLSQKCEPVAEVTDEIRRFLDDMLETMYADKGVGLAAPQVGIIRRACIVMETNVPEGEYPKTVLPDPTRVFSSIRKLSVNPKIRFGLTKDASPFPDNAPKSSATAP